MSEEIVRRDMTLAALDQYNRQQQAFEAPIAGFMLSTTLAIATGGNSTAMNMITGGLSNVAGGMLARGADANPESNPFSGTNIGIDFVTSAITTGSSTRMYMGLKGQPIVQTLAQFYDEYSHDPAARDRYYEAQIKYRGQTKSSFLKVRVSADQVIVEIYRDDAHGGPYSLRETVALH